MKPLLFAAALTALALVGPARAADAAQAVSYTHL